VRAYTFYAAYDGDGLRTVEGYSGSYYLTDGERPVAEVGLDVTGAPNVYAFNGFGASGLEWRGGGGDGSGSYDSYSAYTYDPQGNVVEPVSLSYMGGSTRVIHVPTSSSYDGFGLGYTATADGSGREDPAVGFGGQWGYYRDYTTGLYLLTHRYYDAGAGRFVTRDPIGYTGGINLYGFTGNNPVNESDPEGTQAENGPNLLMPPLYDQNPAGPVYEGTAESSQEHPSTAAVLSGRANGSTRLINQHLAGHTHPDTGVPFSANGHPIFHSLHTVRLPERLRGPSITDDRQFGFATRDLRDVLRVNSQEDVFLANQMRDILSGKGRIDGLTWHHHEDGVTLQLVERSIHAATGHSGGRALTGGRPRRSRRR